ncbi:hypothetical protein KQX54_020911 [Cotesia glomerata]|uniref:Uncharacterized protein n=1 Tax=Cotesia glomerata TaxID=32391 RepID=A0AAV7IUE8_COTGL|nr:hypothetical protein KQX54_020911 [Cotesia glomerata]
MGCCYDNKKEHYPHLSAVTTTNHRYRERTNHPLTTVLHYPRVYRYTRSRRMETLWLERGYWCILGTLPRKKLSKIREGQSRVEDGGTAELRKS